MLRARNRWAHFEHISGDQAHRDVVAIFDTVADGRINAETDRLDVDHPQIDNSLARLENTLRALKLQVSGH